jgi:hypothetical protein
MQQKGYRLFSFFLVWELLFLCIGGLKGQQQATAKPASLLETLMEKYPRYFSNILSKRDSLKVQVIYTQINRDKNNKPSFTNYYFNKNPNAYFYPASMVKMPIALLALQKLHELNIPGLDKNSSMVTESDYSGQSPTLNDPSTPDGRPTIAQYIRKIFLVSDNEAFNRLYEFLGQEYINTHLHQLGYEDVQIRHRLQSALNDDENRHTNPILFYDTAGNLLYKQPMQFSQYVFSPRNDRVGNGYYQGEMLEPGPMDFSQKNRVGLEDFHTILKTVLFPNAVPQKQGFHLSKDDYLFLHQYMSQYPGESKYPSYDTLANWDAYCKFLYWGADTGRIPKNIRIFNKVGDAYGFLTDVSYFVDFDKKIEFMLSATIYCNSDGILNDDKYDYKEIGYPFMKNLGRVIYEYESKRKKAFLPDLSEFKMEYDKR